MSIALLTGSPIESPNCWFNPIFKALQQTEYQIKPLHINLVKDWELEPHDYLITVGTCKAAANFNNKLILDLGYFNRWNLVDNPKGTFQLGINKLNWLAPEDVDVRRPACSTSQLRVVPTKPILVCGQKPGDAQHGLTARELYDWVAKTIKNLQEKHPERAIWYREHPLVKRTKPPAGVRRMINEGSLADCLGMCSMLVTYNSTAALEALQKGLPVCCDDSAFYSSLCSSTEDLQVFKPDKADIERFFQRLGYSQWTVKELSNPLLWEQYIHLMKTGKTPEEWDVEMEPPPPPITAQEFEMACHVSSIKNFPKARKMAKQLWHDIMFTNRTDLDEQCNLIIKGYKHQKAVEMGEQDGNSS